ncbi:MAG TPA: DUF5317 domain-containing protein [Mycobacteriales bacterium]|nr:DUF5317 domain-containing protein [Mycobacteriales bacterium]
MALVGVAVLGAALIAVVSGGRWSGFTHELLRAPGYVVLAVIAQVLGAVLSDHTSAAWVYPTALAVSAACAFVFCVANLRVSGVGLVTIGLVLNAVVVARNGAMPVSIAAASRAGVSIVTVASDDDPRHEIAGKGSVWRTLGDVIPLPLPGIPEVISPGDLLVAAGLAEFIVVTSRRRRDEKDGQSQVVASWGHALQADSMIPWRP